MATYKGIAASTWGKHIRDNLKWKKSTYGPKKDPVVVHSLYLGDKHIGMVNKSKYGPKAWMFSVDNPQIGGLLVGTGYADSFQEAKRGVLYYSNLLQFYAKR